MDVCWEIQCTIILVFIMYLYIDSWTVTQKIDSGVILVYWYITDTVYIDSWTVTQQIDSRVILVYWYITDTVYIDSRVLYITVLSSYLLYKLKSSQISSRVSLNY